MKKFICKKDFYIDSVKFASIGDHIVLLHNGMVVNNNTKETSFMSDIINNKEYFTIVKEDRVNHPSHYTWLKKLCGVEVIDITKYMDFCTGNAVKYLLRAGHKSEKGYSDRQKYIEDLKKAIWYIKVRIIQLENGKDSNT